MKVNIFWFRRDLRLYDNRGLAEALRSSIPVLPLFIFDEAILEELEKNDARVTFIHEQLNNLDSELKKLSSSLLCLKGSCLSSWNKILSEYEVAEVFTNKDYEPYALNRDKIIEDLLNSKDVKFNRYKDQLIFEAGEIVKEDLNPYTIYTPFKNKWLARFALNSSIQEYKLIKSNFLKIKLNFPSLSEIGFKKSTIKVKPFILSSIEKYELTRDIPAEDSTTYLGAHLRFGTVSIREIVCNTFGKNQVFVSELIWREFFSQILFYFPEVVNSNFKKKYNGIVWRNNQEEFDLWCKGSTGYPMVDAGMRQLNETGFMHNRVRMITAGFLCKHLLIDWKWGEAYFAKKLLDYDLASNNGNWQWAAGTGCDSAPYFRIFNPQTQHKKFDPNNVYVKKWIPEYDSSSYPIPIVEHTFARKRALEIYKTGLANY